MSATAVISWPGRAETWLDERGKFAWIAAMVLGFIVFWPIGLALLAYMIWGKKMFSHNCRNRSHGRRHRGWEMQQSSGNAAFDSYRAETLQRLEEEQEAFSEFMRRLREAKDKAEFDQFMQDRAGRAADEARDGSSPVSPA